MRFTFEPEQRLFAETVRDFLASECTPAHIREAWSSDTGRSLERWHKLAAMGVAGLTVPESHGGLGMDETGLVLLLEETGRAALPEPVIETVAVGAPLLAEAATDDRRDEWLGPVAAGEALLAVGLASQPLVADAHVADLLLLEGAGELHAVRPGEVRITPQPSVDGARRLFSVAWTPSPSTRLAGAGPAAASDEAKRAARAAHDEAVALAFDRGALAAAGQLLGLAQRLIDLTADYARERHQFGQPIGSFQAVKHHLADALLALELARPVVYRAAWSVAHREASRAVNVSMAKAYASDGADRAARVALQVHGAIGYTWEYDAHLWMKRAWALAASWGDARWHRRRVAEAVLGA